MPDKRLKPSSEERIILSLERIGGAINGLQTTLKILHDQDKYPLTSLSDEVSKQIEKAEEIERLERQVDYMRKQNIMLMVTIIVTFLGVVANFLLLWKK